MKRTKFSYLEWHYTQVHESLFALTKDELTLYRLLVQEAR